MEESIDSWKLQDFTTRRMSKYSPFSTPSNLAFDTASIFGIALERAKELSNEKIIATSSSNTKANNSDTNAQGLKSGISSSYAQQYPKMLLSGPNISESDSPGMHHQVKEASGGIILSEDYRVMFKATGEIISAMIPVLKYESKCEVQFPRSNDKRCFTLFGTKQSIDTAKQLIQLIINKIHSSSGKESMEFLETIGSQNIDMVIPSYKIKSLIGLGGATIKMLRERTHCQMDIVKDELLKNPLDRILRISGDSSQCRHAQQLVRNLLGINRNKRQIRISNDSISGPGPLAGNHFNFGSRSESTSGPSNILSYIAGTDEQTVDQIGNQSGISYMPISEHIPSDPVLRSVMIHDTVGKRSCTQQLIPEDIKEYQILSNNFSQEKGTKPGDFKRVSDHNQALASFINPSIASQDQNYRSSMLDYYLSLLLVIDRQSNKKCQDPIPDSGQLVQSAHQLLHSQYSTSTQFSHFTMGLGNQSSTYQQSQAGQNLQPSKEQNQCFISIEKHEPFMAQYKDSPAKKIYQSPSDEYEDFLAKEL